MNRAEKALVVVALLNMVLYVPYFFLQVYRLESGLQGSPWAIFPWHFFTMGLNLVVMVVSIRDLYLRPFSNPNAKLTWLLLILLTGGIGWVVYLLKHALRPRTNPAVRDE